jgi:hypothetical protein
MRARGFAAVRDRSNRRVALGILEEAGRVVDGKRASH